MSSTPAPEPAPELAPASASALPPGITDPNYKPLPGRLGNLSVPQQHALDTLRKELQEEGAFVPERMDDALLLR
jgi:phosphatidylinositol/phosphatidylcholine transfer protein